MSAERLYRLLVADDHAVVRSGLVAMLEAEPSLRVVGEASNGRDAVECYRRLSPDVVLMDVEMPGLDGVEATAEILRFDAGARVILLSTFPSPQVALFLSRGAREFLLKDSAPADVVAAIHRVCVR